MRNIFALIIAMIYSLSCHAQTPSKARENLNKLQWLVGEWKRTNAKAGRSGIEIWEINKDGVLGGRGITMKGTDTVLVEKFKLLIKGNDLYYVADVPENKEPVPFKLTSISSDAFACENPAHDFPKVIAYKRQGTEMKATISGDGKAIDYLFKKL